MFEKIGNAFYWELVAPVLRFVFSILEKRFPESYHPLNDISEFSGQRNGKMVLLHRKVFEYKFSEQYSKEPKKKLVEEYVDPTFNAG